MEMHAGCELCSETLARRARVEPDFRRERRILGTSSYRSFNKSYRLFSANRKRLPACWSACLSSGLPLAFGNLLACGEAAGMESYLTEEKQVRTARALQLVTVIAITFATFGLLVNFGRLSEFVRQSFAK